MRSTPSRIIDLSEQRCHDLLASRTPGLGRVGFAEDGNPEWPTILPISYVHHDGAIYFRTFEGSKLFAALRDQRVAFEIDDVDAQWREGWSVVAVGRLTVVEDVDERAAVDEQLESWVAGMSERMVRLDIDQLTGRELIGGPPSE